MYQTSLVVGTLHSISSLHVAAPIEIPRSSPTSIFVFAIVEMREVDGMMGHVYVYERYVYGMVGGYRMEKGGVRE